MPSIFFFLAVAQGLKVGDSWVTCQLARREEGGFYAAKGASGGFRAPGEQNQLRESECNTDPQSHKPVTPDATRGCNNGFCAQSPTRAPSPAQSWPVGRTFHAGEDVCGKPRAGAGPLPLHREVWLPPFPLLGHFILTFFFFFLNAS